MGRIKEDLGLKSVHDETAILFVQFWEVGLSRHTQAPLLYYFFVLTSVDLSTGLAPNSLFIGAVKSSCVVSPCDLL